MCGIAGIYSFDRENKVDSNLLKKMNDVLFHRGPDGEGQHIQQNVGLAHRRLSIIDIDGGSQPMFNETGTISIVFNGEIYNFRDLKATLSKKGHNFRTSSDTEAIIHLYEEKGIECVNDLRGMFAFALWDEQSRILLLARDRLGIKPLYYTIFEGTLYFASEIKSILQNPLIPRKIDPEALSDYFSLLCVPAPKTIFNNIYKLPAGHQLVCRGDSWSSHQYWNLPLRATEATRTEADYIEETLDLLQRVVSDHMISDVPLGAFLSGGVDSSAIVALMQQSSKNPVNTHTIGFTDYYFDESAYARETANYLGTNHFEQIVKPDLDGILEKLVWFLDEPFADSSAIPTYHVCKMVREHVTVALSGDGGDEIFAGYTNYSRGQLENIFRRFPMPLRQLLIRPLLTIIPESIRGRTFLSNLTQTGQRAFFNKWKYFSESMKGKLFSGDMAQSITSLDSFKALKPYFEECSDLDILSQWQYVDLKTYLVDDILTKVDKMSMANSLEVRVPFLDHSVVEHIASIPSEFKLKGNISKYLLKKSMESKLPKEVFERKKHGFLMPVGPWLRKELKEYCEAILFDPKTLGRGYFNQNYIKRLWDQHLKNSKGKIDISLHLWSLLVFELWHRRFIDD